MMKFTPPPPPPLSFTLSAGNWESKDNFYFIFEYKERDWRREKVFSLKIRVKINGPIGRWHCLGFTASGWLRNCRPHRTPAADGPQNLIFLKPFFGWSNRLHLNICEKHLADCENPTENPKNLLKIVKIDQNSMKIGKNTQNPPWIPRNPSEVPKTCWKTIKIDQHLLKIPQKSQKLPDIS